VTNPVAPPPSFGGDVPPPADQGAYPPPGAVPPATEGFGAAAAEKKSGIGKKVLSILGIIIVGAVIWGVKFGIGSFFAEKDPTADAKVGTCLNNEADPKKTAIVDCAGATAAFTVVGKVPDVTEKAFAADNDFATCKPFATAENSLWSGTKGSNGYVLCLAPIKK
jgi:hypothetical protein